MHRVLTCNTFSQTLMSVCKVLTPDVVKSVSTHQARSNANVTRDIGSTSTNGLAMVSF